MSPPGAVMSVLLLYPLAPSQSSDVPIAPGSLLWLLFYSESDDFSQYPSTTNETFLHSSRLWGPGLRLKPLLFQFFLDPPHLLWFHCAIIWLQRLLLLRDVADSPLRTGTVGPFLMLCFVLSCAKVLCFLHDRNAPLFMWCDCCAK